MYLFEVRYQSEAERKRLEYLLSKWEERVARPSGYMFIVEESIFDELAEELGARFPPESVRVHKLAEVELETPVHSRRVSLALSKPIVEVKPFVSYLISKRRGVLSRTVGNIDMYDIYTRKGRVELSVNISGDSSCSVDLRLKGSKDAVELLAEEFGEELRIFGGAD